MLPLLLPVLMPLLRPLLLPQAFEGAELVVPELGEGRDVHVSVRQLMSGPAVRTW